MQRSQTSKAITNKESPAVKPIELLHSKRLFSDRDVGHVKPKSASASEDTHKSIATTPIEGQVLQQSKATDSATGPPLQPYLRKAHQQRLNLGPASSQQSKSLSTTTTNTIPAVVSKRTNENNGPTSNIVNKDDTSFQQNDSGNDDDDDSTYLQDSREESKHTTLEEEEESEQDEDDEDEVKLLLAENGFLAGFNQEEFSRYFIGRRQCDGHKPLVYKPNSSGNTLIDLAPSPLLPWGGVESDLFWQCCHPIPHEKLTQRIKSHLPYLCTTCWMFLNNKHKRTHTNDSQHKAGIMSYQKWAGGTSQQFFLLAAKYNHVRPLLQSESWKAKNHLSPKVPLLANYGLLRPKSEPSLQHQVLIPRLLRLMWFKPLIEHLNKFYRPANLQTYPHSQLPPEEPFTDRGRQLHSFFNTFQGKGRKRQVMPKSISRNFNNKSFQPPQNREFIVNALKGYKDSEFGQLILRDLLGDSSRMLHGNLLVASAPHDDSSTSHANPLTTSTTTTKTFQLRFLLLNVKSLGNTNKLQWLHQLLDTVSPDVAMLVETRNEYPISNLQWKHYMTLPCKNGGASVSVPNNSPFHYVQANVQKNIYSAMLFKYRDLPQLLWVVSIYIRPNQSLPYARQACSEILNLASQLPEECKLRIIGGDFNNHLDYFEQQLKAIGLLRTHTEGHDLGQSFRDLDAIFTNFPSHFETVFNHPISDHSVFVVDAEVPL